MYVCMDFQESYFVGVIFISWKISQRIFCGLIFADHQVEYIVSLSYCFFLRIKNFVLGKLTAKSTNLCPSLCIWYAFSI